MDMISSLLAGSAGARFASISSQLSTPIPQPIEPAQPNTPSRGEAVSVLLSEEAQAFLGQAVQILEAAKPSASERFAFHDVNSDGTISEAEFVETRPAFASEEQASARFAEIDGDADGVMTLAEYEASAGTTPAPPVGAIGAGAPPPPPPPAGGSEADLISAIYDELDTDEDGVVELSELIAGLTEAAEEQAASAGEQKSPLERAMALAIDAYGALQSSEGAFSGVNVTA